MLKRTIALFLIFCIASVISGCSSNPLGSNEYECGDFKFQISGKYSEDYSGSSSYIFSRGFNKRIYVGSDNIYCADIKLWLDKFAEGRIADEKADNKITSTDIVTGLDCGYSAGAVHLEYSNGTGESYYYVENETRALYISADYDLSDKDSVCRDVEKLVKSAEYISNFKLYTGYYEVENDYFSVFVPKEWYHYTAAFAGSNKSSSNFRKVRARTAEEMRTAVIIMTPEESDNSPEEIADESVENYKETVNGVRRFKSEVFGIEAECTEAKMIDPDVIVRVYYFEYGGLLWEITLNYSTDDELADIEDLLGRVELK